MRASKWNTPATCGVAIASGAAALLFETLWYRVAGLSFGNGLWASTTVLTAFMSGLAVGNGLAGRLGDRATDPLRLYAVLELCIGLAGTAAVVLLPRTGTALAPLFQELRSTPWALEAVRFGVAFGWMLLPAMGMGATLPILVRALTRAQGRFGPAVGMAYGWNTLGAVGGALLGETLLIETFGLRGTALAAASLNILAAMAALLLSLSLQVEQPEVAGNESSPALATQEASRWLIAAFLGGAVFLALEVVWFRFLWLFVYGTSFLFASMLAVVLAGISVGGLAIGRWLTHEARAASLLPFIALSAGVIVLGSYAAFIAWFTSSAWPSDSTSGAVVDGPALVLIAAPIMFPTAVASGALLPTLATAARAALGGHARTVGWVTLANTLGAAAGSVLAAVVLLPGVGVERSIALLAASYWVIAILLCRSTRLRVISITTGLAAGAAAFAFFPAGAMHSTIVPHRVSTFLDADSELVDVQEGLLETIAFVRTRQFGETRHWRLLTNGYTMSGTMTGSRRYMKAFVYLPVAIHPAPRDALLISYGLGQTARALADTSALERIDVVDISPDIIRTSERVFEDPKENPLADPRVNVFLEDGRFFLQTTGRRYDLITAEPPPPKVDGVVNLYTREHFALVRNALADGGIATYWLPAHDLHEEDTKSILAAFCGIFEDCTLWTGAALDWMMMGTRGALEPVRLGHFRRQWTDSRVAAELEALGFEQPYQLGATYLAGREEIAAYIADTAPLVDDFPLRLSDRPVVGKAAQRMPGYRAFMDPDRARRAFDRSDFVHRAFPPTLRDQTLASFRWQRWVNALLADDWGDNPGYPDLHEVIGKTSLRTLPLWMLGSSVEEQRILERHPLLQSPGALDARAIGALSARRPGEAAIGFRQARDLAGSDQRLRLLSLELYSLCLAADLEAATVVARELVESSSAHRAADGRWEWFERTFGLPDPRLVHSVD